VCWKQPHLLCLVWCVLRRLNFLAGLDCFAEYLILMLCLQQEFGSNVREQVQLGCWAFKCSTCFVLFILGKSILINFAQKQIVSTTESSYMEQAASCIKMCQPIFPTKHMHEHEASILICSVYLYMQLGNPIAGLLASGAWATDCMQTDRSGGNY
jgi:hypothetical protein